ncbi:MAG TPA: protein translocase subunit SecF [Spirochaetota bacterium]|nr:protein translocase subunit SecF [Spirochaetota bacterium]
MKTNINFVKLRIPSLIFSLTIIILGCWFVFGPKNLNIGMLTPKGFNLGIDFQGGVLHQLTVYSGIGQDEIRSMTEKVGLGKEVQQVIIPENKRIGKAVGYVIKATITTAEQKEMKEKDITAAKLLDSKIKELYRLLSEKVGSQYTLEGDELKKANLVYGNDLITGELTDEKSETKRVLKNVVKESENIISPAYSAGLRWQVVLLVLFVLLIMLLYVAIRFKFQFSLGGILALIHDTLIMLGFISIFQLEIDMTVIAAILTIIGYSINDTIVVFDRIRENYGIMKESSAKQIFNVSINQTLNRTIITSLTTQLAVIALLIWGGPKIFGFAFTLTVGIVFGTYSSIFIASPIVDIWNAIFDKREKVRFEKEKKISEKSNSEEELSDNESVNNETSKNVSNDKITLSKSKLKKLSSKK